MWQLAYDASMLVCVRHLRSLVVLLFMQGLENSTMNWHAANLSISLMVRRQREVCEKTKKRAKIGLEFPPQGIGDSSNMGILHPLDEYVHL